MPESIAIRAIRVAEGIDNPGRIRLAIRHPMTVLQLRPYTIRHRPRNQLAHCFGPDIIALDINHGANNGVPAIRRDIHRHRLVAGKACIATQAARRIK
jgi:hypothetical protein